MSIYTHSRDAKTLVYRYSHLLRILVSIEHARASLVWLISKEIQQTYRSNKMKTEREKCFKMFEVQLSLRCLLCSDDETET